MLPCMQLLYGGKVFPGPLEHSNQCHRTHSIIEAGKGEIQAQGGFGERHSGDGLYKHGEKLV